MLYTDHKPLEQLGHLHPKTLNCLQLPVLNYDFAIQYNKGVNIPADFLSRQTVEFLSAINPFGPDLAKLQTANSDIIHLKHFTLHASWPQGTPKSVANCLTPLASKIFSLDNTVWIRLTDCKHSHTALFLPARFHKCVKLMGPSNQVMMLTSKPTSGSPTTTFGLQ